MRKKQVFWGAGKIGKAVLTFWEMWDLSPDFFCDNESALWGKKVNHIKILPPEEIYKCKSDVTIFLTCYQYAEVKEELLAQGISEEEIIIADSIRAPEMIYRMSEQLFLQVQKDKKPENTYECLIDLSAGMVLGGVERWSCSLLKTLQGLGIKSAYLMPRQDREKENEREWPALFIEEAKEKRMMSTMEQIVSSEAHTVVCNFPFEIMIGACAVKKCINPDLRIIAVLHNDEEIYYRAMTVWEKYIDTCLTISTKIKSTLLERGFPAFKVKDLYWSVSCDKKNNRTYSPADTPLQIGYAGRISVIQKRVDLLIRVAEKLKADGINFCMHIAGSGDYEEELKRQIREKTLDNEVRFVGVVDHEHIMDFWKRQDVCISCSEWEGHSISHSEAMAAGAVLVITDTSGARDDVEEGVNGFLADVGDIEALAKHLVYLAAHRELLHTMGSRSVRKIAARNESMEPERYWRRLLEEKLIWRIDYDVS